MDATRATSVRQLLAARPASNGQVQEFGSESEYAAYGHGRISRQTQHVLIFRFADGSAKAFAYSYFFAAESDDPACGFTLDFTQQKVKLFGRNLELLFQLICQHRVAEIREAGRSQAFELAADAPIVECIELVEEPPAKHRVADGLR